MQQSNVQHRSLHVTEPHVAELRLRNVTPQYWHCSQVYEIKLMLVAMKQSYLQTAPVFRCIPLNLYHAQTALNTLHTAHHSPSAQTLFHILHRT